MNTDELDQIIKDYLTAIDTDYAIMVSGDWGSGKSYYITHILSPQLKRILLPTIKGEYKRTWLGNYKKRYYSLAYISLYGLSSVVDFEVRVFNGINSWTNHRLIRTLGLLGSKAGEYFGVSLWGKDAKAVTFIGSDRVLVFDDLERICEDKISVKEVLGLINSYAEHSHLKVIIVCNEKHFFVDGEDNNPQTDYQTYKEKCVRFTYKFVPDVSVVYDAIINKIGNGEYKSYLLKEKITILSLFDVGGKRNLRTLKFIIDSFEKIYLLSQYSKYKEKVIRTYLVTFMLYSCEYKQGRHAKELNTLEIGKNKVDINSYAWRGKNAKETKENNHKDYEIIFKEKYYKVFSAFRPCHLLIEYIESGNLDEERFKKEIGKLDADISKQIISKEGKVYQRLLNMSELNDEDVANLLDEMMEFVEGDKYNLYELLNIYALLLKYDYWNVGGFELTDKLDGEFRLSMQRQKVNHRYDDFFEGKTPIFDNSSKSRSQYQKYRSLKDFAISINRQVKNEDEIEKGKVFLTIVESGNVEELRNYRIDTDKYIPLAGIEWNRMTDLIKTASNPVACELCECLISFISEPGSVKPDDREKIKEELLPSLDKYLMEKRSQIRRMYVTALKDAAEGVL